MDILSATGAAFTLIGVAALLTRSLEPHHCYGLMAIGYVLYGIQNILENDRLWTVLDAAACAWFAWQWWTGGGDDDTKRRLRRWARKFTPVRRTAPAGA